jgi:hypothetical protein
LVNLFQEEVVYREGAQLFYPRMLPVLMTQIVKVAGQEESEVTEDDWVTTKGDDWVMLVVASVWEEENFVMNIPRDLTCWSYS